MTETHRKKNNSLLIALLAVPCVLILVFAVYVFSRRTVSAPEPLNEQEQELLAAEIANTFSRPLLSAIPYDIPSGPSVYSLSAILADAATGSVIYEKNADAPIPPASMTKLVVMHVVFQEIAAGHVTLADRVPLPPETWAINAPPQSSLMFLGENQRVTLDELLLGLAVSSGNDAAVAVALHISGSVEAFVERMNAEIRSLGLTETVFVEPSGYSELNMTTAREFAAFCRVYIERYPQALEKYHSARRIAYPQAHNMPEGQEGNPRPYIQNSTNRLLDSLQGCDGLKTGFIYESGYNLALTAKRQDTRFISVTLGGPGKGTIEGNFYRNADGSNLMEWGFEHFYTVPVPQRAKVPVTVWQGTKNSVDLVECPLSFITVPRQSAQENSFMRRTLNVQKSVTAPVQAGTQYGTAVYSVGDTVVQTVPLVAARSVAQSGGFKRMLDTLAKTILE